MDAIQLTGKSTDTFSFFDNDLQFAKKEIRSDSFSWHAAFTISRFLVMSHFIALKIKYDVFPKQGR